MGHYLGGATLTIVVLVPGVTFLLVARIAWRLQPICPLSDPAKRESLIRRNGRRE
jgi:hypothetical protein